MDNTTGHARSRRAFLAVTTGIAFGGCLDSSGATGNSDTPTDTAIGEHPSRDGPARWVVSLDGEPTDPVSGQHVYVGAGDTVYALDHTTGEEVWSRSLPGPIIRLARTDGTLHAVAEVPETVTVLASPITITGLDPATGDQHWQAEFGKRRLLTAAGGLLLLVQSSDTEPSYGEIAAYSGSDGSNVWARRMDQPDEAAIADGTVYGGAYTGLYTFDLRSGRQGWHREWSDYQTNSLVVGPKTVAWIEGSWETGLTVYAANRAGEPRWSFDGWEKTFGLTHHEGRIFVGGERLGALDAETGERYWTRDRTGALYHAVVGAGAILSPNEDVRAYDLTDGTERWAFDPGMETVSTAAIRDETVYIHGAETVDTPEKRHLYGVDVTDGQRQWHLTLDENPTAIVAGSDGAYVGETTGVLYALP